MEHPNTKFTAARVRLQVKSPQYNGQFGVCGSYDSEKQRYIVTVNGKQLRIKPENLQIISEQCGNCSFVLPPLFTDEGFQSYESDVFSRLICCGKGLCHQCCDNTPGSNDCIMCGKKKPRKIVGGGPKEVKALKKFAKKGHAWADVMLGMYYLGGVGVKASHDKSRRYFDAGAKLGDPHALYHAGVRYNAGQGEMSQSQYNITKMQLP